MSGNYFALNSSEFAFRCLPTRWKTCGQTGNSRLGTHLLSESSWHHAGRQYWNRDRRAAWWWHHELGPMPESPLVPSLHLAVAAALCFTQGSNLASAGWYWEYRRPNERFWLHDWSASAKQWIRDLVWIRLASLVTGLRCLWGFGSWISVNLAPSSNRLDLTSISFDSC